MFIKKQLHHNQNVFESLTLANLLESFSKSRQVGNIYQDHDGLIPIVRTTTPFTVKSEPFKEIHLKLVEDIKKVSADNLDFNNAMVEIYTSEYAKMGYHTDQALDLAPDSFIAVYSCYEDAAEPHPRLLVIKNKTTGEVSEISMDHDSVIIFSTSTNEQHVHKIVCGKEITKSRWLGVTFRLSQTFAKYIDDVPHFMPDKKPIRVANDEERRAFCRHKRFENQQVAYRYPQIDYSLSSVI